MNTYKDQELQNLISEEKRLVQEESWLLAALTDVKTQKIAIEVEILQLDSMLRTKNENQIKVENREQPHQFLSLETQVNSNKNNIKLMDQAESSINTMQLDLSIGNEMQSNNYKLSDMEDSDVENLDDYLNL